MYPEQSDTDLIMKMIDDNKKDQIKIVYTKFVVQVNRLHENQERKN